MRIRNITVVQYIHTGIIELGSLCTALEQKSKEL